MDVGIANFRFSQPEVKIRVGDTVRWTVKSGTHTTTSTDKVWDSDHLATGSQFSFTFTQPGTYSYFCSIHTGMQAVVIVEG